MDTSRSKSVNSFKKLKINWRRGSLRRYQSISSFAATFCALNGLSERQFVTFWDYKFRGFTSDEKAHQKKIAHFLDEPIAIVKTVFSEKTCPVPFKLDHKGRVVRDDTIRICVDCLAGGLHASFHDDFWLKRCLIHNTQLTDVSSKSEYRRLEGRIHRLRELHAKANSRWPTVQLKSTEINRSKSSSISKYLQWRIEAVDEFYRLIDGNVRYSGNYDYHDYDQRVYRDRDLDLLFGRLAWRVPMPDRITDFFVVTPCSSQQPILQNYGVEAANELSSLLELRSLGTLLWVYRLANLIKGDFHPYQQIVETAISTLSTHQCNCKWAILGGYWTRFAPGVMSDYSSAICPYKVAAEKLRSSWLELFPGLPNRPEEWSSFWTAVQIYVRVGVATVIGYKQDDGCFFRYPLLEFHMTDKMANLLEIILERFAQVQVKELEHWLDTIDGRDRAPEPTNFPPSVYLDHNERGELQLVIWPVGYGRTLGIRNNAFGSLR